MIVLQWNSRGYDLAKWQAQKLDMLSPVWFQIVPVKVGELEETSCQLMGAHDLDQSWFILINLIDFYFI
jgi:hypothetical protein